MSKIKFGTDGWRAIIAEDFTFENVITATKAIAAYIDKTYGKDKPILIGYDTRFLADKFAQKSAEILAKAGFNVKITSSDVPTPILAYSAKLLNTAGAIMFTASHNPPEYCGIKYIPDYAGPANKAITDIIVENVSKLEGGFNFFSNIEKEGTIENFSPKEAYFEIVENLIDFDKISKLDINICFDPLYATARGYFDTLLEKHGSKVKTIHNWRDVLYGGGMPEPREKFLKELKELVIKTPNSIGFSNDGDGDRFGVIDEKGNFVSPNEVIAVVFRHLVKNKGAKGAVVRNIGTSLMIDKIAENYGVEVIEVPVGFKWICEEMRKRDVIIGGEESGGLTIQGHIPEKDGIVANLCVLEAMAYEQKPLYQIINDLKSEIGGNYINKTVNLKLDETTKNNAMERFISKPPQEIAGLKVCKTSTMDGVKFYLEDKQSWILIRPSGTEPLLRIAVETDSEEKLNKIIESVEAYIK